MRFETSQQMKLGQQMKLAPRMIQSMEILQMPLAQLEERIEQELENNITLELVEASPDEAELTREREEADRAEHADERELDAGTDTDDFERLDSFNESNPESAENEYESWSGRQEIRRDLEPGSYSASRFAGERDAKTDAMANTPARAVSLGDQLLGDWALTDVDGELRPLGELIIQNLEDDGYLRTPLETVLDRAPATLGTNGSAPTLEQMERALSAVQLFCEPAGVAARDARECLLLQLDALEDEEWDDTDDKHAVLEIARTLVEHHLDDLMQNRLPKVAEKTGLSLDEIKTGLSLMRRLSLSPARRLAPDDAPPITPDAIVEYDDDHDRYIAYLNESRLPNLQLNREYARMSKDKALAKRDRDFIKTNLSNASWLIDALGQRRRTLLRVVNVVVEAQREFFDYGPQALKPLPMTLVAEQLGVHVATVSRAVADKHLMTPRGIVPLRRFFTGGTQTETGEEVSWDSIRAALQEIVDAEDKKRPLSDEKLVEQLKGRGIEIARRTVAKYRNQLGIQSARLRKQF